MLSHMTGEMRRGQGLETRTWFHKACVFTCVPPQSPITMQMGHSGDDKNLPPVQRSRWADRADSNSCGCECSFPSTLLSPLSVRLHGAAKDHYGAIHRIIPEGCHIIAPRESSALGLQHAIVRAFFRDHFNASCNTCSRYLSLSLALHLISLLSNIFSVAFPTPSSSPDPLRSITSSCPPLFSPLTSPSKVLPRSPAITSSPLITSPPSPGPSHLLSAPLSVPPQLLLTPTTTHPVCAPHNLIKSILPPLLRSPPASFPPFSSKLSGLFSSLLSSHVPGFPSLLISHPLPLFKSISSHSPCLASSFRLPPPPQHLHHHPSPLLPSWR